MSLVKYSHPWFDEQPLSRIHIVRVSRLRLGYNLLPTHPYNLS